MKIASFVFGLQLVLAGMAHTGPAAPTQAESKHEKFGLLEDSNRCWTGDQITGPIWSNDDAQQICPAVCGSIGGYWTGNWVTVIWGERSVCSCTVC